MGAQASQAARNLGKPLVKNEIIKPVVQETLAAAAVTNHPTIHDKDPELVITATEVSKGVEHREPAERPISEKNFKLFHAMQKVPRVPQTPRQYEALISCTAPQLPLPPDLEAVRGIAALPGQAGVKSSNLLPSSATTSTTTQDITNKEGSEITAVSSQLVPARGIPGPTDITPLSRATTVTKDGLVVYGPRPAEGSGNDQLVLQHNLLDRLLEPFEVYEVFRKHAQDPNKFTAVELASQYDVEPELIEHLLKYAAVPEIALVDGEFYGVYDIKDLEEETTKQQAESMSKRQQQTAPEVIDEKR